MVTNISGRTRIYGIIADPIAHVKTPELMAKVFADRKLDAVLIPIHARAENLKIVLDGLRAQENFGGFIATVPHKTDILSLCDEVTIQAQQIGAANCIRRNADGTLTATMLDGIGFIEGLRAEGRDVKDKSVVLIGAGGAACAIGFALAEAGAKAITILNRTKDKAQALVDRIAAHYPSIQYSVEQTDFAKNDVVINATSLGLQENDAPPIPLEWLAPHQLVCEIIMEPTETKLMRAAKEIGCQIQYGRPMLAAQIGLMADHMGAVRAEK